MVVPAYKRKANQKWDQQNRGCKTYVSNRAAMRTFLKDRATAEDLNDAEELIKNRRSMWRRQKELTTLCNEIDQKQKRWLYSHRRLFSLVIVRCAGLFQNKSPLF